MPKRYKYTPDQVIDAIVDSKGLIYLASKKLGCTPQTIRNYARRYRNVARAIHDQRGILLDVAELGLYNALLSGEAWAITLTLKLLGRERGYTERQETHNLHIDLSALTDDQLERVANGEDVQRVIQESRQIADVTPSSGDS
jgi:hypothetical protein